MVYVCVHIKTHTPLHMFKYKTAHELILKFPIQIQNLTVFTFFYFTAASFFSSRSILLLQLHNHSRPLNNKGVKGTNPRSSRKSTYNLSWPSTNAASQLPVDPWTTEVWTVPLNWTAKVNWKQSVYQVDLHSSNPSCSRVICPHLLYSTHSLSPKHTSLRITRLIFLSPWWLPKS